MGFRVSFGRGALYLGTVFAVGAILASGLSLVLDHEGWQIAPLGAFLVLGTLVVSVLFRREPATTAQGLLCVAVHATVCVAACSYRLAASLGDEIGPGRVAALQAIAVGILVGFAALLVRAALLNREHRHCLGLALACVLAGMLVPLCEPRLGQGIAHGVMAVGYLVGVGIQWGQLREANRRDAD